MDPRQRASLRAGHGLAGNFNQGGKRQVTVIARERWEAVMKELESDLDPSARRANLMVSGICLAESVGRILRVGSCRLRVHGETLPCRRMEETLPGLEAALAPQWSGGIFGEILDDGEIRIGETVRWDPAEQSSKV